MTFREPDWSEFFDVIKGNGPCNVERMDARNKAWDEGSGCATACMAARAQDGAVALEKHAAE